MRVVIRVDASFKIGTGHVMRTLTLARELRNLGAEVLFICRDFPGKMSAAIQGEGYNASLLARIAWEYKYREGDPSHADWLSVPWEQDVEETIEVLARSNPDWLVVDHYGIDQRWHARVRPHVGSIMVIDDLADRKLDCDLLMDQTFGREKQAYRPLIPGHCTLLLGTRYALLRPEFARLRPRALEKRQQFQGIRRVLVSMGGSDTGNHTMPILEGLSDFLWKKPPVIDVVLGVNLLQKQKVEEQARFCFNQINILSDVTNMAELMLEADVSVGAGGTTSWERCCMALPSILVITAANQKDIGRQLHDYGATITLPSPIRLRRQVKKAMALLRDDRERYAEMSVKAAEVCNGDGAAEVAAEMTK